LIRIDKVISKVYTKDMVRKIFKPLIALSVIAAFAVFSVLCCCTFSATKAYCHKSDSCSHCPLQGSQDHSSNSSGTCQHQFLNAELLQSQTISSPIVSGNFFPAFSFLDKHRTPVFPVLSLTYPPGGPPLGISFTPLYLRTFDLRV
jgi:hypothetical protein